MAGSLTWEVADGIAVVTFDLPDEPVNKITQAVKEEFIATFETLGRDPEVKAVAFFSGKRDAFIAGADIEEFVAITSPWGSMVRVWAGGWNLRSPAIIASPPTIRRPSSASPKSSSASSPARGGASGCRASSAPGERST